jgi:uncharacterized protein
MRKTTHVPNSVSHFEVAGSDFGKLGVFYKEVFGWDIVSKGPGYSLIETPDASINGALLESDLHGLTIGITVPDLATALEAAVEAGGTVIMPATDNGWVTKGQVKDPAGNLLSLIQA